LPKTTKSRVSEEGKSQWAWQVIVVTAIPVLGYTLAFIHEAAFCDVFSIPREFIILDWISIITSIGGVLISSFLILWIMLIPALLSRFRNKRLGPIARRFTMLITLLLILLLITTTYLSFLPYFPFLLAFLLYFAILDFLGPLITQKGILGYRNKLEAQDKHDAESITKFPFVKQVGKVGLTIVFFILLLFSLSYLDGRDSAMRQEEFLVPSTYQESVVLRIYGDKLICAPIDRERHQIVKGFFLIRLGDDSNLVLIPQKVGPLKVPLK